MITTVCADKKYYSITHVLLEFDVQKTSLLYVVKRKLFFSDKKKNRSELTLFNF